MTLKQSSLKFLESVEILISHNINITKLDLTKAVFDFKQKKASYYLNLYKNSYNEFSNDIIALPALLKQNLDNKATIEEITSLLEPLKKHYLSKDLGKLLGYAKRIYDLSKQLRFPKSDKFIIKIPKLPNIIKEEVTADIKEIEKCFNYNCFRSSIILCGRIMETTLHRKYYESTGTDLLEKAPGIGIGKLIAKLQEKSVPLPAGLTQQIHLINQTRIFTVHKKQSAFIPSKEQANAIILFTIDVLEKLF